MSDKSRPVDQTFINIEESTDKNFWCEEFNMHDEELEEIVGLVGPIVHDVRMFIAKRLILSSPQAY